jgi:DNA-binding response OmpR family regulator
VRIAVENNGDDLRIAVHDRGPGIPDDFKPHIFAKFAQADATDSRQKGGTGLGLSIVKEIVGRQGGKVGFENAAGGGAIFYIDLPVWDDAVEGAIGLVSGDTPLRILLCAKDPAVRTAVRMRLSSAGLTVDFAHTVQTAIARCGNNRYAAVVFDLPLSDGDAFDAVAQIRKLPHHVSTLILVASEVSKGRNSEGEPRDPDRLKWVKHPLDAESLTSDLVAALPARLCPRPRILHVDDDRDVLAAVAQELTTIADVVSVDSINGARRVLATGRIDLAIVDIELGTVSGLDLLPDLRDSSGKIIPVIIFSNGDETQSTSFQMTSPLEFLKCAVCDRLGLSQTLPEKEVA